MSERARHAALVALVALVAFLPFLRGTLAGACFYFRDLSLYFFPLRRLALERLRAGELALWNPYVHEGVPLSLPALGYLPDLLGALSPGEPFLTLLLSLHVPLGAVFFLVLAQGLGLRREAACGGALVYALGGFFLSTLNLYVYVQAAAWAPLVVLTLVRVLRGDLGPRPVAAAALSLAVALTTTGVEIVGQAVVAGLVLGMGVRRPGAAVARLGAGLALGVALAAPVLVLVAGQVEGSARGHGFAPDVVLAHSLHPFALVQTVVGSLFGNPANLANEWWGENFFPRGFPYVLSLYLGAAVLALAAAGLLERRPPSGRLLLLLVAALVLSLGRWGALGPLLAELPALRAFRFPVKAFFSVHLSVALLAGLGLHALADGRGLTRLARVAGALGLSLVALPLLPLVAPDATARFALAFLPPRFTPLARATLLDRVLGDAATGGALALVVALLTLAALARRIQPTRAAWLVVSVVAVDLLRTGAGLNPMVSRRFYEPSAELEAHLPLLRGGRVYTCPIESSPAFHAGRAARGRDHEVWSFAVLLETLSPAFNVPLRVPTALSPDLTMLVSTERVLSPEESSCAALPQLLPRLRAAGVITVLSLDPLEHEDLAPLFAAAPVRTQPVAIHAYALRAPLPRFGLSGPGNVTAIRESANRLDLVVDAERASSLVVRDAWDPGWTARIDGAPVELEPARHRLLELPAGRHHVSLSYVPRRLALASLGCAIALVVVAGLARRRG